MIGKLIQATCFCLFLAFLGTGTAYSQGIDFNNIRNIDVDQLSDTQIRQVADQIKSRGLSESEFEALAKSRGASSIQIQKLNARIRDLQSGISVNTSTANTGSDRLRNDQSQGSPSKVETRDIPAVESVFGRELFTSENLTFQPSVNIPTPVNYQLGPGDELIIDVWGASERTYRVVITPEGSIRIPNLGPIYINGMTIQSASRKIKSRLKRIYSGLDTNTYSDISLGQAKSIKVNLVGELENPGSFVVSSFATVFNALYLAGGPNENGSLRNIELFRNNKRIASIDVYDFLFNGINNNPTLNDGDLIIVRAYDKRVQMKGAIKRPGYYEIKEGETLEKVLGYAGGFMNSAYRRSISISRNEDLQKSLKTVDLEDFSSFEMKAGDEINISEILNRFKNKVKIEGAVFKPGNYELTEGMTLSKLIKNAEGLREDAFLGRGSLTRLKSNFTSVLISFDLNKVISGEEDIALEREDFVEIKSNLKFKNSPKVRVEGEVRKPGEYFYIDSMTVEDLILRADGFTLSAVRSSVEVARRKAYNDTSDPTVVSELFDVTIEEDLSTSETASNFYLKPFDLVVVRRSPNQLAQNTVEIEGEVNLPGKYVLEKKDERISDLLKKAGGISSFGYVRGATLIRVSEFFDRNNFEADKLKRDNLQDLSQDTTSTFDTDFDRTETIGIDLEKILKYPGSKYDLILKAGDVIGVPRELETVRLRGELLYPSVVRYDENFTFKDYISQAGGFSSEAKKGKAYILYANGTVQKTKRFLWFRNYPPIKPGAEVIIPKKPDRRKLLPGEIIGLVSGIGTIALIINNLSR